MASSSTSNSSVEKKEDMVSIFLTVTGIQGSPRVPIQIDKTITSSQLRQRVCAATCIPLPALRLIFRGRMIVESDTTEAVTEFKLENGSVLHCMGKPVSNNGGSNADTSSSNATTTTTTTTTASANAVATTANTSHRSSSTPTMIPSMMNTTTASDEGNTETLDATIQRLRSMNSEPNFRTAVVTLDKILSNIIDHPSEAKYRQLKTSNPTLQRRLGGIPGGDALMRAVGFERKVVDGEEQYVLTPSAAAWPRLVSAREAISVLVQNATSSANIPASASSPTPATARIPLPFGNYPLPAGGGIEGSPSTLPGMDLMAVMDLMMRDPAAISQMMQNPLIRNMVLNDPRIDPAHRQFLEEHLMNPQAMEQVSRTLNDPVMRPLIEQAMQHGFTDGFSNSGLSSSFSTPPPHMMNRSPQQPPPQPPQQQQQQQSQPLQGRPGGSDEDLTEEEMIAEAIRRSLQDQNGS